MATSVTDVPGARVPEALKARVIERLRAIRIAGRELSHTREANLAAIDKLLAGNPFYTLGIKRVDQAIAEGRYDRQQVLARVAAWTRCSSDLGLVTGPNYISPEACFEGLVAGAQAMRRVIKRRGTVVFGAGHSGSMISAYNQLAGYFLGQGCRVPTAGVGAEVQKDWYLDFVGHVAVVSDTCGIHHTHMTGAMAAFLDALKEPVDLAIADHGFGGECLNRGIMTVAAMDTNDPGFALAHDLGLDFVLVPMNDNLPNAVMKELADLYIALIEQIDWRD